MNILLTGGNGFLAKELKHYFLNNTALDCKLLVTDRTTLNVTDYESVRGFFENNVVDVVIHTAVKGGKRLDTQTVDDIIDNILMFKNLSYFSDQFKIMFNFGSGAEFNRMNSIDCATEESVSASLPTDYYGLSKNIIARKIAKMNSNIYNLRLFGCFGQHEEPQRLFRSCYNNFKLNQSALITCDKYMDYFYAQDVGRVIEHIIEKHDTSLPRDINLCYPEKYTLSEHAQVIKDLTNAKSQVIIEQKEMGKSYTGKTHVLDSLNIDLTGLNKGVKECLKSWNKL